MFVIKKYLSGHNAWPADLNKANTQTAFDRRIFVANYKRGKTIGEFSTFISSVFWPNNKQIRRGSKVNGSGERTKSGVDGEWAMVVNGEW